MLQGSACAKPTRSACGCHAAPNVSSKTAAASHSPGVNGLVMRNLGDRPGIALTFQLLEMLTKARDHH